MFSDISNVLSRRKINLHTHNKIESKIIFYASAFMFLAVRENVLCSSCLLPIYAAEELEERQSDMRSVTKKFKEYRTITKEHKME